MKLSSTREGNTDVTPGPICPALPTVIGLETMLRSSIYIRSSSIVETQNKKRMAGCLKEEEQVHRRKQAKLDRLPSPAQLWSLRRSTASAVLTCTLADMDANEPLSLSRQQEGYTQSRTDYAQLHPGTRLVPRTPAGPHVKVQVLMPPLASTSAES